MHYHWVFLSLFGLSSPALADTAGPDAIQEAACRWIETYTGGDLDALMQLYDPEASVMLHGQPALHGLMAIREFFSSAADDGSTRFDLLIDNIVVHGDLAHLVSRYWLERTDADGEVSYRDAGRSLLIYRKSDRGAWRIYVDIDQSTPDARWEDRPETDSSCS